MPNFMRAIGVDYSGAQTPKSSLSGLEVFCAEGAGEPCEILPPPSPREYFTRIEVAQWLLARLREHSDPGRRRSQLFIPGRVFQEIPIGAEIGPVSSTTFAGTGQPMKKTPTWISFATVTAASAPLDAGNSRWRKLAERRCGAKSSFHFDIPGSAAKSTHAGLPWLRYLRQRLVGRVPFLAVRRLDAAARPLGHRRGLPSPMRFRPRQNFTPDQRDAYNVALWLSREDREGRLALGSRLP